MNRRMICKILNGKDVVCDQAEDGALAVGMIEERMRATVQSDDRFVCYYGNITVPFCSMYLHRNV